MESKVYVKASAVEVLPVWCRCCFPRWNCSRKAGAELTFSLFPTEITNLSFWCKTLFVPKSCNNRIISSTWDTICTHLPKHSMLVSLTCISNMVLLLQVFFRLQWGIKLVCIVIKFLIVVTQRELARQEGSEETKPFFTKTNLSAPWYSLNRTSCLHLCILGYIARSLIAEARLPWWNNSQQLKHSSILKSNSVQAMLWNLTFTGP